MFEENENKTINEFHGDYRWLSNFYPCIIEWEGIQFPTVEHAFVAAKTLDNDIRLEISKIETPGKAKRFGKELVLLNDWDSIKVEIMFELLKLKFTDPELKAKLKATGDAELIEGNVWGDVFWGVCDGIGKNVLGKLLMKIRKI